MAPSSRRLSAFAVPLLAVSLLAGCSGSSSSGSSSSSSTAPGSSVPVSSAPPASSSAPVPAIGTSKSGELFPRYTDSQGGFSIAVPGGWNVHKTATSTHFGRLGDVLIVQIKDRKHPMTVDGANMALHNLAAAGTATNGNPAVQLRHPTGIVISYMSTRPINGKTTPVRVYRYYLSGPGKVATLTFSAPATAHNAAAYQLIAASFRFL